MHILQVGSYLAPNFAGGAEISADNIRRLLEQVGHRFTSLAWGPSAAFTPDVVIDPLCDRDWVARTWRPVEPITALAGLDKARFYAMELATRADAAAIGQLIAAQAIDLVLVHSFRGLGYDLVDKLCQAGVPVIFVLHDFALVCLNKGMARKGALCRTRCLVCRHVARRNRRALAKSARLALVAPSRAMLNTVGDGLNIGPANRHHIPNPNRYTVLPRVRDHRDTLCLGYIGRLEADKGVAGLIGIADRLHGECGLRLVIAGQGRLSETVSAFAATRPWVDFRGQVPAEAVHHVYDAVDVLAIPSLWPENFPGVVVHALGSGLPCVGFDIGGIPEVIDHGETGFVVGFGDFAALADRIIALDRDRALLAALSRAALAASARYDAALLGQRWIDLIGTMA